MNATTKSHAKARLAARKLLGMTAEQYNQHERELAANLNREKTKALRRFIIAGINGDEAEIDAALANCRTLGINLLSEGN